MGCISGTILGCALVAQLTAGGTYSSNLPTTATSYDGVQRDISRFYQDEQTNFHIAGVFATNEGFLTWGYDNGLDTAKLDVNPTYQLGITKYLNENISIGFEMEYGGATHNTPCYDQFNREYYCMSLTEYKGDYDEKATRSGSVKLTYRF